MSPPSEGTERRKQLELLQEELQALKSLWGRALRLQKANPAEAPATAPFPIVLTFHVDPPPAATAHYDVSSVRIQIHLSSAVLQLPQWSSAPGHDCGAWTHELSPLQALPPGTRLVVLSEELPLRLRNSIEQELIRVWLSALGISKSATGGRSSRPDDHGVRGSGGRDGRGNASGGEGDVRSFSTYKLSSAASYMQESFAQLISLVPELLEPYQAEDQHGATVRRYTILCNDADADTAAIGSLSGPQTGACQSGSSVSSPSGGSDEAVKVATRGTESIGRRGYDEDTDGTDTAAAALPGSPPGGPLSSSARPVLESAAITAAVAAVIPAATTKSVTAQAQLTVATMGPSVRPMTHGSALSDAVMSAPSAVHASTPQQWLLGHAAVSHEVSSLVDPVASATATASAGTTVSTIVSSAASGENPRGSRPFNSAGGEGDIQRWVGAMASNSEVEQSRTIKGVSGEPQAAEAEAASSPAGSEAKAGFGAHADTIAKGVAPDTAYEDTPTLQPPPPPLPPPPGLMSYSVTLKELQYIQKRYSQVFSARVHHEGPATAGSGGCGGPQTLLQPGCLTTFELELLPTDPDWDLPAVRVVGQLLPVSDTAYLPSLGVHLASRLPSWLRAALEVYMAEQLAAQAEAQAAVEARARDEVAAATAAAAAATAQTQTQTLPLPTMAMGRGLGLRRGGGRESRDHVGRGRGVLPCAGGDGRARGEPELAPEGTVLLPLGVLRNLFRDLENYAGTVARVAYEERRRREREAGEAAAASGGRGSTGVFHGDGAGSRDDSDEGDGGGLQYDDDGYGDGSHRRDSDAVPPMGPEGSEDYGSDDNDEDDEGNGTAAADEIEFSGAAAAAGSGTDLPAAYAVLLEGLQLDNLAAVEVLRANFEVSCARCGSRAAITIASSAVASGSGSGSGSSHQAAATGQCQRCAAAWSLVMRPHFVHATSNNLCVIKPEGCCPIDLLPSLLAGQCGECNAVMSLRDVQVGLPFSRNCSSCHKETSISMAAVSFVPKGPPRNAAASRRGMARTGAAAARRPRSNAGGGGAAELRPGQHLPALGTCKHYRHSYRWLRFPCCGMRFPCDLCHEEAVSDGHPARWAQRMVCGFCSTEQPLALGCRACGRQLAGSSANPSGRHTRFWEGGMGCRDPRHLDKKDPHKWRGRNKTISAKQSRVGPKPWSGKGGGGAPGGSTSG